MGWLSLALTVCHGKREQCKGEVVEPYQPSQQQCEAELGAGGESGAGGRGSAGLRREQGCTWLQGLEDPEVEASGYLEWVPDRRPRGSWEEGVRGTALSNTGRRGGAKRQEPDQEVNQTTHLHVQCTLT